MNRFRKLEIETSSDAVAHDHSVAPKEDSQLWMNRADADRRNGQYESALRFYSRALELQKDIVKAWVGQVQMLVMLGEYPEADIWSRKALELFPQDGDLMASRAQSLCRRGHVKAAYSSVDGAMSQPGNSGYRWTVRGELLLAGKQSTDRHCFDKALQIDDDWLVATEIALIYLDYNQPSNAQNRARVGVERAPDSPYAWYVVGLCQSKLGLHDQARRSFNTCLELSPGHRGAEEKLQALRSGGSLWKRFGSLWRK